MANKKLNEFPVTSLDVNKTLLQVDPLDGGLTLVENDEITQKFGLNDTSATGTRIFTTNGQQFTLRTNDPASDTSGYLRVQGYSATIGVDVFSPNVELYINITQNGIDIGTSAVNAPGMYLQTTKITFRNIPTFSSNAIAKSALGVGAIYRNGDNLCLTH